MSARSYFPTSFSRCTLAAQAPAALRFAVGLALLATPAFSQVKLSQVYGGGGNDRAPLTHDYMEIYNAGALPVDVSTWSVQYASSTGTTWTVTPLATVGILGPGQYALVQQAVGTTVPVGQAPSLPAVDATGTTAMSATDAKVALVSSVTALVGGTPTYVANPTLVDFVGFGTLANWNDASAAGVVHTTANNAPPGTNIHGLNRLGCGAQDSDNSKSDWAQTFPVPRNKLNAPNGGITSIGMAHPWTLKENQTATLLATPFRCGTINLGLGTTASVDLTAIGGPASVPMLDDGVLPDELAGDGIFTANAPVAAATTSGTKTLPVTLSDGGGNTGGTNIMLFVSPAGAGAPDNDGCLHATPVAVGGSAPGNLTGATQETNAMGTGGGSPTTFGNRRGVWYSVVGNGNTLSATTCSSLPLVDTVMWVFGGTCDSFTTIGVNDEGGVPCTPGSIITWCSQAGTTYYIFVAHFNTGAQTSAFTLNVADLGVCSTAFPIPLCTGVAGPYTENEPGFGPETNPGCTQSTQLFTNIATPGFPGTVLLGSSRGLGPNRDIDVYRFQATVSDTLTMTLDGLGGASAQATLQTLTGPTGICPATTVVGAFTPIFLARCSTGTQTISAPVTAGTWYDIQVLGGISLQVTPAVTAFGGQLPGARSYQYRLNVSIGGPPINDNCASSSLLTLGAAASAGNTALATVDGTSTCDPIGRDLWYRVTTTATGTLNVDTCGSAIDTALAVFSACGGTELACNDDCGGAPCGAASSCVSLSNLPAGTYTIRVSDKGTPGTFQVKASFAVANDPCSGAILITSPSSTNGTTLGATLDAGLPICDGPGVADSGGNTAITAPSLWYRLVGTGATVYADTLTAGYDTKISVYTGSCGAPVCVTMNDDISTGFRSKVAFNTVPGQDYFLMVHGFGTGAGTFTLNLTNSPTPSNDLCGSASAIGGSSGAVGGTNVGATGDPSTYQSQTLATCATDHTYWDTWYAWTAPCTANVTFRTCGAFDTIVSLHSSCATPTVGNQIAGMCNDNGAGACSPGSELVLAAVGGTTYIVRVATAGAQSLTAGGGQPYTLSWQVADSDGDGVDDCLDGCPLDPLKIAPGICGCGVSEVDTDGDGTPDCVDGCPLDPLKIAPGICGCGVSEVDTDGDGTPDCIDGCPLDPLKIAPGICGCGIPDIDSDGDGTPDCLDGCPFDPLKLAPGICGCGVPDTDSDGDGTPDCLDGCPTDPLKIAPGQCGCGIPDTDGDGDGVADCIDNCPTLPNAGQADCDGNGMGDVCEIAFGFQTDCDGNGVPDNCDPDCNSNGRADACDITAGTSFDLNLNGVPDECEAGNGTAYCFGDGSGTPCPCGNNGLAGEGCANSTGRGALLYNAGGTSVFLDNAAPLSIQLPAGKPTMFVASINQMAGGAGAVVFDGKLCVDNPVKRFAVQPSSPTGTAVLLQPVTNSGGLILNGSTWHFQAWFRDGALSPCGFRANLSNGLSITFTP